MVLLAVDTSGKHGSIGLARVGDTPEESLVDVLDVVPLQGGTFSAQLVPQISALLAKHGFHKQDIAGFAVASGPGSFTGLRVGLAAIKALAEILHKPIAAVSLLHAAASFGKAHSRVAALDAGRGEVYVGEYNMLGKPEATSERLLTRDEFLAESFGITIVTPDTNIAELARQFGRQVEEIPRPTSAAIARLGWEKILAGNTISVEQLDANYIRRSDAEIFANPG
jgi:tRNA threonylcarbamoyladenosine biosynthesis protein TsaB